MNSHDDDPVLDRLYTLRNQAMRDLCDELDGEDIISTAEAVIALQQTINIIEMPKIIRAAAEGFAQSIRKVTER